MVQRLISDANGPLLDSILREAAREALPDAVRRLLERKSAARGPQVVDDARVLGQPGRGAREPSQEPNRDDLESLGHE